MSLGLLVHACSGVADREQDVVAGRHRRMLVGEFGIKANARRAESQFAATGHGVARVDGQIQDDLLDLPLIGLHRAESRIERDLQLDVFAEKARQHLDHILNNQVQVQNLEFPEPAAG